MKTKIFTLTTIIIICFNSISFSQRILQNTLSDFKKNTLNGYLKSFLNGDYKKASEQMMKLKNNQMFNFNEFYENSIVYQRDYKKLRKDFEKNPDLFSPSMNFYITQTPMKIILKDNSTVNLSKNRIVGIIGADTLSILFDTGGAGISINKRFVDKYKMKTDTTIKSDSYMPAFNYKSLESPVIIPKLIIGSMTMTNVPAKYNTESKELKGNAEIDNFDIIMGMDIFVGYIKSIKFDWINNTMTFSNKKPNEKLFQKFIFFDAKPITLMNIGEQTFTTLLDTGSPVDLIDKEIYQKNYTKKEEKKYGTFIYNEFTVPVNLNQKQINLKAVDYKPNFNLKLNNEIIDFVIGNNHKILTFDLINNLYELE